VRNAFAVVAGTILFAAASACASGGANKPAADSNPDSENRQLQPPCLGTADGDCPSGNPLKDF
jgi:hypothetical protein